MSYHPSSALDVDVVRSDAGAERVAVGIAEYLSERVAQQFPVGVPEHGQSKQFPVDVPVDVPEHVAHHFPVLPRDGEKRRC